MLKWVPFHNVLAGVYRELGIEAKLEANSSYLEKAYRFTEPLWASQLDRAPQVRLVLLSEAPLFGDKQSYIYNPESPLTRFFFFAHFQKAFGVFCQIPQDLATGRAKKSVMLDELPRLGVIVLDVFRYALNPNHTAIAFGTVRKKSPEFCGRLFRECAPHYLRPKLDAISGKSATRIRFAYRYAPLRDCLDHNIRGPLVASGLLGPGARIDSVHKQGGGLDADRLLAIYRDTPADA